MAQLDVAGTMEAIAQVIIDAGACPRAYAWPNQNPSVPAALVGYPTEMEFDFTFRRCSDRAVFPVTILCGNVHDKSAVKVVSDYINGTKSFKAALDGDLDGFVQTCRVTDATMVVVPVNGVDYISVRFDLEVIS